MKIIELKAENVKRLKAVHIKPDSNVVMIGGDNGAGKSTVLDCVAYALGGKTLIPSEPIRHGEKQANIEVDFGTLKVIRSFSLRGNKSELKIVLADGGTKERPQDFLTAANGVLWFDPLAFSLMSSKKQRDTLKALDPQLTKTIAKLDNDYKVAYSKRTEANREAKFLAGQAESCQVNTKLPARKIDVSHLRKSIQEHQTESSDYEKLKWGVENTKELISQRERLVAKAESELAAAKADLRETKAKYEAARTALEAVAEPVDISMLQEELDQLQTTNTAIQANESALALQKKLGAAQQNAKALDNQVRVIEEQKTKTMAAAKFPIPGLSFDEEGVRYQSIPFDQISQGEGLRVSVAIGLAKHSKIRVMLIRDGSILDSKNLAMVIKMAEDADTQVWIERVGDADERAIIIEDGQIREVA